MYNLDSSRSRKILQGLIKSTILGFVKLLESEDIFTLGGWTYPVPGPKESSRESEPIESHLETLFTMGTIIGFLRNYK